MRAEIVGGGDNSVAQNDRRTIFERLLKAGRETAMDARNYSNSITTRT